MVVRVVVVVFGRSFVVVFSLSFVVVEGLLEDVGVFVALVLKVMVLASVITRMSQVFIALETHVFVCHLSNVKK